MVTRKLLTSVLASCLIYYSASAQVYTVLNDATVYSGCHCFQLTPALTNQGGGVYQNNTINLTNSFDYTFSIFLGCNTGGADGICFILTDNIVNIGSAGGGLGYGGLTGNSLAVEYDTYRNGWDPPYDHMCLETAGDIDHTTPNGSLVTPIQASSTNTNIKDCNWHTTRLVWNVVAQTYTAYFDGVLRFTYTGNILANFFGGNPIVNWGWSGGTGALDNTQRFCVNSVSSWIGGTNYRSCDLTVPFQDVSTSNLGTVSSWAWNFGDPASGLMDTSSQQNPTHTYTTTGTFTVSLIITDITGCPDTFVHTVVINPPVLVHSAITDPLCHGDSTGTISLTLSGGTLPYGAVTWGGGATGLTRSGLPAGIYTYSVSDSNSCSSSGADTLTQPLTPVSVVMDSMNIRCFGEANGMTWTLASGGTGAYTYSWSGSPVQTTDTATALAPGTYSVTAMDANHCVASDSVHVTQPPTGLTVRTDSVNVLCYGLSTGQAWVIASGGTPGYTYLWSNTQAVDTITAISAAAYTVTVTDMVHCTATATVNVSQPPSALSVVIDSVNISCKYLTDGQVTATPSGGTPGYTFRWSTTATTDTMSHLSAGIYVVTITDANNCTLTGLVDIAPSTDSVVIDSSVTAATCGLSNGSVTVTPSGGSGNYSYIWSTTSTSQTISGLSGGTYMVTVTDANLCSSTRSVSVRQFPALQFAVTTQNDTCGLGHGTAAINATSGTQPVTDTWIPAGTNPLALDSATYILTLTDSVGCTQTDTFSIGNIGIKPEPSFGATDTPLCPGNTLLLSPFGTFASYQWQDGSTKPQYTVNDTGYYTVTVTNSFGCRNSVSITVNDQCDQNVIFPTAFSPNGDTRNDFFFPVFSGDPTSYHMRIYDRWGELVFETFSTTPGWDGTYKGIAQPIGTYMWFTEYSFVTKVVKSQSGNITLLR